MKKKISKNKLENFNLPLSDNRFLYDFEDEFLEVIYPIMWKNVALYVENNHWKKIEEEYKQLEKDILMKLLLEECPNKWLIETLTHFIEHSVKYKKSCIARELMVSKLREYNFRSNPDYYIVTKDEMAEIERNNLKRANETFVTKIEGNWLKIVINKRTWKTTFNYENLIDYIIFIDKFWIYKRDLLSRELEIVNICAKQWLYYKYIWEIFGWHDKSTIRILKKLWITNVFLTPQKDIRKSQKIKVLDFSWYFVVEKDNDLFLKVKND